MSMSQTRYLVLGFATTHDALDAEALLEDLGVAVTPIPAPSTLSAKCGIALRLAEADEARALEYLERAEIIVTGRTRIEDMG